MPEERPFVARLMRLTMREEFEHSLATHADRVAIVFGDTELTYADLDRWSATVGAQLASHGVGVGDAVALYMRNCPEFIVADIAIARLGAVKVPINFMLPGATTEHILKVSDTAVLVAGTTLADEVAQATSDLPDVVVIGVDDGAGPPAGITLTGPGGTAVTTEFPRGEVTPDATAAIYFSSGTTGLPKGVRHSQSSTVALHHAQLLEAEIRQEERLLLTTPLAHAAGLFAQSAIIRGARCVLVNGFDAKSAVGMARARQFTWTFLVPTMIYRMLDVIAESGSNEASFGIDTIVYGAAPISPSRLEEALHRFGQVFVQLYGQTESPNWGTRLAKSDHDLRRPYLLTSCGQASIAADVAVVDDDGKRLPFGEVGEIWLKTPYLLTEYVKAPDATREKFLDGGIRTGDIGVLDERGYLYLRDRKSDMVISGGMNVYCREVEDVLSRHPNVASVAVIGIPHDDWGEAVHAVVVPRGGDFDADELLAWCKPQLAAYSRPKTVEVVTALPETPFGKIDKKALREPHWASRSRSIG